MKRITCTHSLEVSGEDLTVADLANFLNALPSYAVLRVRISAADRPGERSLTTITVEDTQEVINL